MTTNSKTDDGPKPVDLRVKYLGLGELANDKLTCFFVLADTALGGKSQADIDRIASCFTVKRAERPGIIGGVYHARGVVEGGRLIKLVCSGFKWTGDKHLDSEQVAGFKLRHDAAELTQRSRKLEKTEADNSVVAKVLAPLKKRYEATDYLGRLAIEVLVLTELRRVRR